MLEACREICREPELKAAEADRAMWGVCGVGEVASVYKLQSKMNHACDPTTGACSTAPSATSVCGLKLLVYEEYEALSY